MEKKSQFPWIKQLESSLLELDEIPLLSSSFAFDFPALCQDLEKKWEIDPILLAPTQVKWLELEEIHKGVHEKAIVIPLTAPPVEGELFWVMAEDDVAKLTTWILSKEKGPGISSEILQEGFYHYLLLEVLESIQKMPYFEQFSFKMNQGHFSMDEGGLCLDLQIQLPNGSLWGRLILPPTFRKSWKEYFTQINPHPFSFELAKQLEVPLGIKIGNVLLMHQAIENIHKGDFLVLDQISFDPKNHSGKGILTLGNLDLFQLNLKPNACEIADLVSSQEAEQNMEEQSPKKKHKNQEMILDEESSADEAAPSNISEIPFTITVEIARMRMTLANLMKLEPGNLLELPKHPEEGVALFINGKKVGKGELIYLGETLGVRILDWSK